MAPSRALNGPSAPTSPSFWASSGTRSECTTTNGVKRPWLVAYATCFWKPLKSQKPSMKIINPATEEVLAEVPEDTLDSVHQKFRLLMTAQPAWQAVPLAGRIDVLKRFYHLLETNIESLALVLTSEVGKPLQQARNE